MRRREPIFDVVGRTARHPARHHECTFSFLNRIAGPYWDQPRHLVQAWADRVEDDTEYADLRARLRSSDDHTFASAFLELYLHEMFRAAGYDVSVHPQVPGTTRRPDLRVDRDGVSLYVEAITPAPRAEARAAANRRRVFFDTIDSVGDPNFLLWLDDLNDGPAPAPGAVLRAELRRWLASLHPDEHPEPATWPEFGWAREGWSATFRAVPKAPHARGAVTGDERSIGVYAHMPAVFVDEAPRIKAALTEKHHAYGQLRSPFIVAVGLFMFDRDHRHSAAALYGRVAYELSETPAGAVAGREFRQRDGYFGSHGRWANPQVSGVLLVNQLQPYLVPRAQCTLWRHPEPSHPLPDDLDLPVEQVRWVGSGLEVTAPPHDAAAHFGLPDPWPVGNPWPEEDP